MRQYESVSFLIVYFIFGYVRPSNYFEYIQLKKKNKIRNIQAKKSRLLIKIIPTHREVCELYDLGGG